MIVILEGLCGVITFDSKGNKNDFFIISSDKYNKKNKYHFGYQIKAKLCHTLISLSKESVLLEIKNGPFIEKTNKFIPKWSPKEKTLDSKILFNTLKSQLREKL